MQAEACFLSSLCFGAFVRLVLGDVRFAGLSLHFQFVVCWSFGAAGFGWYSFLQAEPCILSSLCVGPLVRLVLGGVHFVG